jgi:hypothetical protein
MRPPFPHAWDSTMIGTFRSCPQKLFRSYIEHWKPGEESVHLVAGKAFATGIQVAREQFYVEGKSPADSVALGLDALLRAYGDFECPADSPKSIQRTAGALEFYFENYRLGMDRAEPISMGGKRGIEFSFAEPILDVTHPVTGDPIIYTGRSDMVANAFGGVSVYDEKTASSLGQRWVQQWDLRSQFTGYVWALRQIGIKANFIVVRGVSILKTKYETQQAITGRADWEVDRWYTQVCRDIERAKRMWEDHRNWEQCGGTGAEAWDYNLDHACTEYGGCAFTRVCKSREPEGQLRMYFTRRVWDPLAREELSIDEWNQKWQSTSSTTESSGTPSPDTVPDQPLTAKSPTTSSSSAGGAESLGSSET